MKIRRVAVVVLNWNGWSDTLVCLNSLYSSVEHDLARIIIVDNASTDESLEKIRQWLDKTRAEYLEIAEMNIASKFSAPVSTLPAYNLIPALRNLGYAAGNNIGINLALQIADTEYVFVLNNDTIVEADCIARLTRFADCHREIGIVGSTLVEDDGHTRTAGGAKYNPLLTMSKPVPANSGDAGSAIDYICGAAMFIRAAVFRQVGLFSHDYFLYFEELDLTRRAMTAGFGIGWCPDSTVYHLGGRAAGSRTATQQKSALAEYHSNLSCLIFTRKFYNNIFWLAAPLRFVLKSLHSMINRQLGLMRPLVEAYWDYFCRPTPGSR
jgi:GT2 family glycosyltransferase